MNDNVLESAETEDLSELAMAIAEHVAILSQSSETPSEFTSSGEVFEAGEVDLKTSAWMTALAAVQGWLRLPSDLIVDQPEHFAAALEDGLECNPGACAPLLDGVPRLTAVGMDRLFARLQRAVRLQQGFLADLETEGGTIASATGRWLEAWEEEDNTDVDTGSGPVAAKALTWSINDFSDRADENELNLSPSYQRGDVWPTSDSQMLIESILRGIPLPSVIILKPSGTEPYEVVDGKQRLTSILRFIGKHPVALNRVAEADTSYNATPKLAELFATDYPRFRKAWKNHTGEQLSATTEREYYFPFKLRTGSNALSGDLARLQGKFYSQITEERVLIADTSVKIRSLFEKATDYKIPLIEYSRATRKQIHEVFNLYNKQGKHLNAEEIRNAVYHDVKLMRALLVASGDNPNVADVAPFLKSQWPNDLDRIGPTLLDYKFGTARYRRTKLLSWLTSMLLVDSITPNGPRKLSTARHTDALLERIQGDSDDLLRSEPAIRDALGLIGLALEAHSAVPHAWAPRFRDTGSGSKWQELQLVASVLGVTMAAAVLGQKTLDALEDAAQRIAMQTASKAWQRPGKTQTATQWLYIAKVALGVLGELGVSEAAAEKALTARFKYSCVPTLRAVADGA